MADNSKRQYAWPDGSMHTMPWTQRNDETHKRGSTKAQKPLTMTATAKQRRPGQMNVKKDNQGNNARKADNKGTAKLSHTIKALRSEAKMPGMQKVERRKVKEFRKNHPDATRADATKGLAARVKRQTHGK